MAKPDWARLEQALTDEGDALSALLTLLNTIMQGVRDNAESADRVNRYIDAVEARKNSIAAAVLAGTPAEPGVGGNAPASA